MLTGTELGAAIEAARKKKNITKKALAEAFQVAAPSVQGWVTTGRIDKSKLIEVIRFFSDVVGPEHWGLSKNDNDLLLISVEQPADEIKAAETSADLVLKMLEKHRNSLSREARQRIAEAVKPAQEGAQPRSDNAVTTGLSCSPRVANGDILIPQYDIRASMGHGQVPADYVEAIRNVVISESLLQEKGVTYSSPFHLAVITGWGQSMEGTINDKDPVIVDRGVNEYVGDGVYVITWAGYLFIKRLQLAGENKLELISDNPNHKDRIVPMDEVTIHAKVLLVWNARKL